MLASMLMMLLLQIPFAAVAQENNEEGRIAGIVENTDGTTLPGAQVAIKDLQIGSVTGPEGKYTLESVPAGEHTVEASFVGYRTKSKQVTLTSGETTSIDFTLQESAINLDEVVVTGTGGPVEQRKLGNSIGTIDAADLQTAPVKNFSNMLQGREPGLEGLPSSGTTGEGSRIRIRGSASLSQSNEPVVYIDGVRVDAGGGFSGTVGAGGGGTPSRLDDINPLAIDRVEVLKGAAAATLYGSEASNGVIQIFTKKGSAGPLKLSFQTRQGIGRYPDVYEPIAGFGRNIYNSQGELEQSAQEVAARISSNMEGDYQAYEVAQADFVEDLYETGRYQTYSLSASGGNDAVTYFLAGRWSQEDGPFGAKGDRGYGAGESTLTADTQQLGQFNANLSITPSDKLEITATTSYTDRSNETFQNSNNIYAPLPLTVFGQPRLISENNLTGSPVFATPDEVLQITTTQSVQHYNGSVGISYYPLDMLTLDATFGADFSNQEDVETWPFGYNIDGFSQETPRGARYTGDRNNTELTYDVKGTLENEFGSFESSFVVGSQGFFSDLHASGTEGVNFPGPGLGVVEAADQRDATEFRQEVITLGVFGQEQLGYNDWVFLTLGGRLDANSAFGQDFNAAFYPKIQGSLPLTDAPFWSEEGTDPLSSLRVRVAWGQSGLQPGAFDALTTYAPLSSEFGAGIVPSNLGNPDLQPEESTEWEVGLESAFYDDRYALEATYWNRTVSSALVSRQFPLTGGFRAPQLDNIGELKGQGLELALDAALLNTDDFNVQLFANASYLWQQVTSLGGASSIKVGGSYPRTRNFIKEGYTPGAFFGAKILDAPEGRFPFDTNEDGQPDTRGQLISFFDKIDPDTPSTSLLSELNSYVLRADESGDGDFLDHYLGKPVPDWKGSFGGSFSYKNFRLETLFEYKTGNYYVSNLTDAFRRSGEAVGRNTPGAARLQRDYITGGVDENYNPLDDPEVRFEAAQEWVNEYLALAPFSGVNTVESADFVRWRELSLTYQLPESLLDGLSGEVLRGASFTLGARNLALWTKYSGGDPEVNSIGRGGGTDLQNNFLMGNDVYNFPLQRRYSATLRIQF